MERVTVQLTDGMSRSDIVDEAVREFKRQFPHSQPLSCEMP